MAASVSLHFVNVHKNFKPTGSVLHSECSVHYQFSWFMVQTFHFLKVIFPSPNPVSILIVCVHCVCSPSLSLGGCTSSGLTREELHASLATVQSLAVVCGADMMVLREKPVEVGYMAECLVRKRVEEDDFLEVR